MRRADFGRARHAWARLTLALAMGVCLTAGAGDLKHIERNGDMQRLRTRLTVMETKAGTTVKFEDLLKDYFDESLGILDRLLTALGAPRPPADAAGAEIEALLTAKDEPDMAGDPEMARVAAARPVDSVAAWQREVYALEADELLAFLDEELEVHARRKRLEYEMVVVTNAGLVGDGKTNNREALERLIGGRGRLDRGVAGVDPIAAEETRVEPTRATGGVAADGSSAAREISPRAEVSHSDAGRADLRHREAKGLRLVFPAGDYYFAGPEGKGAGSIVLEDVRDLILEGRDGARIVTSGAFMAGDSIRMERCRSIVMRNLVLDMSPLPFAFGTIRSKDDATAMIEMELLPNSPEPDASYWANPKQQDGIGVSQITIRAAGTYHYIRESGNGLAATAVEPLGDRRYRIRLRNAEMAHIPIGATAVWHTRGRGGEGRGLHVLRSRHILFDRVCQQASDLVSVWLEFSGGVQFVDCDFVPPEGRPAQNNADGFHAPRNQKGPYLDRCRLFAQADDCLNFYSPASSVSDWNPASRELMLLVTYPVGKPEEFLSPGDPVALMNSNDGSVSVAKAVAVEVVTPWETAAPGKRPSGQSVVRVTLDRDVPGLLTRKALGRPATASYLEYWSTESDEYKAAHAIQAPFEHMAVNLRYANGGFIIRNCQFGYNRALGFKCKAGNGVIRNSRFIGQALLFETSLTWREGFLPHDIEVTDTQVDWFCFSELGLLSGSRRGAEAERLMPRIRFEGCRIGGPVAAVGPTAGPCTAAPPEAAQLGEAKSVIAADG